MTDDAYRAKTALVGYASLRRRIRSAEARIRELRDMATRATSSYEAARVGGTGARSRVETAAVAICDLETREADALSSLRASYLRIRAAIGAMEDSREAELLEARYLDGRSWNSVNTAMGISETWSRTLHARALEHFAEKYF